MTVKDILKKYLEDNNFDGLYNDNCGCKMNDLIPCGGDFEDCKPGFIHLGDDDYDYLIKPEREAIDSVKEKW